jgi:hypothetical protein
MVWGGVQYCSWGPRNRKPVVVRNPTPLVIAGICLLSGWAAALKLVDGIPAWLAAFLAVLAIATLVEDAWPLLRRKKAPAP